MPDAAQRPSRTVLHLIDTTGPGGAETVFTDLVREMPDRMRSVAVVAGPGWVEDTLVSMGAETVRLPAHGGVGYLRSLVRVIRATGAEIVQAHLIGSALYGSVAARLGGAKAVCTFHGPADLPEDDRHRALRFRVIGAAANRVVFVSEALRSHILSATPLREPRTAVIHNGVSLQRFGGGEGRDALRRELGLRQDVLLLGALGNIRAPKDYTTLLRAVARLSSDLPPWHLAIAGDTTGTLYEELVQFRAELDLTDRVTFLGFRRDPASVLAGFDLFVLSSTTEGFSLATVQAMASGLPVVVTRSGGPEEIVRDGDTGFLVPIRDPVALGDAIARLVRDERLRLRLGKAAEADVRRRFSMDAMVREYTRIYDALSLAERTPARHIARLPGHHV